MACEIDATRERVGDDLFDLADEQPGLEGNPFPLEAARNGEDLFDDPRPEYAAAVVPRASGENPYLVGSFPRPRVRI